MLLNLSDISGEPLQSQIIRQLRAKILNGELAKGEPILSIRALSREARVSVITVERAYSALEAEGLIFSRRGKGFFVAEMHDTARKSLAMDGFIARVKPVIDAAAGEGLSPEEILSAVRKIIINKI